MSIKSRKFSVCIADSTPPSADFLFESFSNKYALTYISVYKTDDKVNIFFHFINRVLQNKLYENLVSMKIKINNISICKSFVGEILTEHGERKVHGGSVKRKRPGKETSTGPQTIINNNTQNIDNSTTNHNNNINLIIVNPIGMESLDHITPEFIQKLLSEHHGPDVVFKFGTKMYSLQENMNFKTDLKSGYISGRLEQDGAWETHRKNEGFGMLMDNLKNKNEEAVLKHMESLPYEDLLKFERDMGWIHEHKYSGLQEDVPVYNKFVREGFNLLSANIADKARRIERDTGKKLKLV